MKTILRIGFLTVAALLMVAQSAVALQVSYTLNERGDVTVATSGGHATSLNVNVPGDQGDYLFTGSVVPDRVGLIGVSSGFEAAVNRIVPGVTIPQASGGTTGGGGGYEDDGSDGSGGLSFEPVSTWDEIEIDTTAVGIFQTTAQINGLTDFNDVGFVRFDWVVDGISSLFLNAGSFGNVTVHEASSVARLGLTGDLSIPDAVAHTPTPGPNGAIDEVVPDGLALASFLVPVDTNQLVDGEIPEFDVSFELEVQTRLNITNDLTVLGERLGNFQASFNADFSNTATLTTVTVLDGGQQPISGASVVVAGTTQSLVGVPEPSSLVVLMLVGCAGSIRRRRHVTDAR